MTEPEALAAESEELRFRYQPNFVVRLGFLMFLLAALVIPFMVLSGHSPDILKLSSFLDSDGVRLADLIFAVVCGAFAVLGGYLLVMAERKPRDLVLGKTFIVIPQYGWRNDTRVAFSEIRDFRAYAVRGAWMAVIKTGNRKAVFTASMLESRKTFDRIVEELRRRAGLPAD